MPAQTADVARLWQRLAPERWPLKPEDLPAGSALVGGAVRDALLGRLATEPDLDVVVPQGAIALCRRLAKRLGGSPVVLDQERDIARLVLAGWTLDLAAWEGDSLESDLRRRDYSINAIALPLAPGAALLDPSGGLQALARGELVAISSANLRSDPLRLLRGLRLACELGLSLEPQTQTWIAALAELMAAVAGERVLAELEKLCTAPAGHTGLLQVQRSGLLTPWLQQAPPLAALPRLDATHAEALGLQASEWSWALPLARLACLADGAALERLRSSRALQKRVQALRQQLQVLGGRPLQALDEAPRLALQQDLEADLPALLLLTADPDSEALLARWRDPSDPLLHPRPPVNGTVLAQRLQLRPGPGLGHLLQHLCGEQAFGRLPPGSSADAIDAAAQAWLARQGEPPA